MNTFYSFPANFGEPTLIIPFNPSITRDDLRHRIAAALIRTPIYFPNIDFNLRTDSPIRSYRTQELLEDDVDALSYAVDSIMGERNNMPAWAEELRRSIRPIYFPRLESLIDNALENSIEIRSAQQIIIENARFTAEHNESIEERVTSILNDPPRMTPRPRMTTDNYIHEMLGRAMAEHHDRMILNFFYGFNMFTDEEAIRRWFEEMGISWPDNTNPITYLTSNSLIKGAKTLRQRCFAQLFNGCNVEDKLITLSYTSISKRKIDPFCNTARGLMAACRRDKEIRRALSKLPISRPPGHSNANDELIGPLQDLADIITHEIKLAYTESYYPGVVDVDPLTDEHVEQIMTGMQREIDREQRISPELGEDGEKRMKRTVHLPSLPKERKIALAERRRRWFSVFGITPESWKKGTFSLWKVSNDPFPEDYKRENEVYA